MIMATTKENILRAVIVGVCERQNATSLYSLPESTQNVDEGETGP